MFRTTHTFRRSKLLQKHHKPSETRLDGACCDLGSFDRNCTSPNVCFHPPTAIRHAICWHTVGFFSFLLYYLLKVKKWHLLPCSVLPHGNDNFRREIPVRLLQFLPYQQHLRILHTHSEMFLWLYLCFKAFSHKLGPLGSPWSNELLRGGNSVENQPLEQLGSLSMWHSVCAAVH